MQATEMIALVAKRETASALAALSADPTLARARDAHGVSVVCMAVYRGMTDLARALAAARDDLDVFEAACVGDAPRVQALAARDPSCVNAVSPDGFSPAGYAAFFAHPELLRALVRLGADVRAASRNAMRVCPLHSAAATRDPAKAVELSAIVLAAGADPDAKQQAGFTALHEAAHTGNLALIDLLLRHGADPKLANDAGRTPAELARADGHEEAARRLGA